MAVQRLSISVPLIKITFMRRKVLALHSTITIDSPPVVLAREFANLVMPDLHLLLTVMLVVIYI